MAKKLKGGVSPGGPGNFLTYLGDHAIGYNTATVGDGLLTVLEFTTGAQYIIGTIQFNGTTSSSQTYQYQIKFNSQLYQGYVVTDQAIYTSPDNVVPVIIPPHTTVICTAQNIEGTNTVITAVSVIGRVYE